MSLTVVSDPLAVVQYKWELPNIPAALNTTILSKAIKFMGERAFRVGIKPLSSTSTGGSTVFFVASNLNRIGIKVFKVMFYHDYSLESKFKLMNLEAQNGDITGSLQLFSTVVNGLNYSPRRFIFEIHFTGIAENYQFQERDCLLKNQMWSSVLNQIGTDFEFVAAGRSFPVHKYVLVARSPIFAALFSSDTHFKKEENVSAASMEHFLKFIYSGELEEPMNDPDLLQLATDYKIKTLESLCRFASHVVNEDEMMKFAMQFRPGASDSHPHIMPDEFEIDPSSIFQVFSLTWNITSWQREKAGNSFASSPPFEYREEKFFSARLETTKRRGLRISLFVYQHGKIDCQVREVACSFVKGDISTGLGRMSEKIPGDEKRSQKFSRSIGIISTEPALPFTVTFCIKSTGMVANFDRKLMDSTCGAQLWAASIDQQQTDVEFLVEEEIFSAHRCLLSARSPVYEAMFASGMKEATSGKVNINDIDPDTFRNFLEFLYTGTVVPSSRNANLFVVADKYQVETLMDLCRHAKPAFDVNE